MSPSGGGAPSSSSSPPGRKNSHIKSQPTDIHTPNSTGGGGGGGAAGEGGTAGEEGADFSTCMFCGASDKKWNEDALDLHYWKVTPRIPTHPDPCPLLPSLSNLTLTCFGFALLEGTPFILYYSLTTYSSTTYSSTTYSLTIHSLTIYLVILFYSSPPFLSSRNFSILPPPQITPSPLPPPPQNHNKRTLIIMLLP